MNVRLIAKTEGLIDTEYANKSLDEMTVGIARLSSSREINDLFAEPEKLLRHCILNQHWSVFDSTNLTFEIITSRDIGREFLRHKSLFPAEFCISGDSKITLISPKGKHYYKTIEELYNKFEYGAIPIKSNRKINGEFVNKVLSYDKLYTIKELTILLNTTKSYIANIIRNNKIGITENNNVKVYGKNIIDYFNRDLVYQVIPLKERIKNIKIKTFDLNTRTFKSTNIKDIFYNGEKDVYKVTLKCGREIKCTREHKFYTTDDFKPLKDLNIGDLIGINGIPVYQSKEWLLRSKQESIENKEGVEFIAKKANCSYHTIRKWLKIHDIKFTPLEKGSVTEVWNKNKSGYNLPAWSKESKLKKRQNTKKGKDHHSWRGGGRGERVYIQDYINLHRKEIYDLYNGKHQCQNCGAINCEIDLHHIEPIVINPYKAYDITNIKPLCKSCHKQVHKEINFKKENVLYDLNTFDWDKVRPEAIKQSIGDDFIPFYNNKKKRNYIKSCTTFKTVDFSEITKIEYIGTEKVYDLEVEDFSHNYVANKILVHNSARYAQVMLFEDIELRKQSKNNRQSSLEVFNPIINESQTKGSDLVTLALETAIDCYDDLLKSNTSRETARFVLPGCAQTKIIFNGTLRSWITTLNARLHHTAQKEARLIAEAIKDEFIKQCPIISQALYNFDNAYNVHILDRIVLEKFKVYNLIDKKYFI